jgi:hypothetical protein
MSRWLTVRALSAAVLVHAACAGQSLQPSLSTKAARYETHAARPVDALQLIARDFRIPLGIEWIKAPEASRSLDRTWYDATPLEMLSDVVKAMPGHELEASGEVVHVLPTRLRGSAADVLNARLGSFEAGNSRLPGANVQLTERIRAIMIPRDMDTEMSTRAASILFSGDDPSVSFKLADATVREALDKMCTSGRSKVWIVAYPPELSKTAGGFYKMVRPGSESQPADAPYWPGWECLAWGMPAPERR